MYSQRTDTDTSDDRVKQAVAEMTANDFGKIMPRGKAGL